MRIDADAVLKFSLALAALIAGAGVGYYYAVFLPGQEVRRAEREDAAQAAADRRAENERRAAARAALAQKQAVDDCKSGAELAYRSRWTQACRAQSMADRVALADCRDDWFRSDRGCLAEHPVRPEHDCNLPPDLADTLGADRARRIAQCEMPGAPGAGGADGPPYGEDTGDGVAGA